MAFLCDIVMTLAVWFQMLVIQLRSLISLQHLEIMYLSYVESHICVFHLFGYLSASILIILCAGLILTYDSALFQETFCGWIGLEHHTRWV